MPLPQGYSDYLQQLEQQYSLPSGLLGTQMQAESSGNPDAVSPAGAVGAFQFMPSTAQQYGIDPTDPIQAAQGAAKMNSDLLKKYNGDLPSALAAYNWGQGNLDKKGIDNAPAETKGYVSKIMAALNVPDLSQKPDGPQDGPPAMIPWTVPGQAPPLEEANNQSALSKVAKGIGNFLMPSANAAEMPQTPSNDSIKAQALPDMSSLSDEELQKLAGNSGPDLSHLSDEQLQKLADQGKSQDLLAQNVAEMGQGLKGAAKQEGAYALNALQGLPGGTYTDEGISGLGALLGAGQGDSIGQRYDDLQARQGAYRQAGQQLNPGATALGQIGTALATTPLAAKYLPGPTATSALGAITKGALTGAAYGGIQGFGQGDDLNSRLGSAASNAGLGAVLGGAIPAGMALRGAFTPTAIPTSDELRAAAGLNYGTAESNGATPIAKNPFLGNANPAQPNNVGALTTQATDNVLSKMGAEIKTDPAITRAYGKTPAQNFMQQTEGEFGGKPMGLSQATEIDKRLTALIDEHSDPITGKLTSSGRDLFNLQTKLREGIVSPSTSDVIGSETGFAARQQAVQTWAQAMRMGDIERITQRAELSDNPATALRSGFKTLASNPTRLRGYSDNEQALIRKAAEATLTTSALRTLSSRLVSIMSLGTNHLAGAAIGHVLGPVARTASYNSQLGRANDVMRAISGVKNPQVSVGSPLTMSSPAGRSALLHYIQTQNQ